MKIIEFFKSKKNKEVLESNKGGELPLKPENLEPMDTPYETIVELAKIHDEFYDNFKAGDFHAVYSRLVKACDSGDLFEREYNKYENRLMELSEKRKKDEQINNLREEIQKELQKEKGPAVSVSDNKESVRQTHDIAA